MRIPIVNEQDEIIGYEERETRNPKHICRVTGLWVTDKDQNILLAQRALVRKFNPGMWGPAVSGTVEEGETYKSNIIKEAREEIGLVNFELILGPKNRVSSGHEYFGQWFTAIVDNDYLFVKQIEKVENIKWFAKSEIIKLLDENPAMFSKNFRSYLNLFSPDK